MTELKKIRITQIRSKAHRLQKHKATLIGLGLRRIGHTVDVIDTAENRGMINSIHFLIKVEA